jgi:hypothetical protein
LKQELKYNQGTLDKANILVPNDALILKIQRKVKQMLEDYERALQEFDQVDILEPNDAFILKTQGYMK